MAFDAVTVRCLVKELQDKLINGRIDKIHQPEKDEITMHVRTRSDSCKIVLSASPAHPRAHFTDVSKKNPITAPMFCMLLRKHIGSGKITAIEQDGFERIIRFSIESYDELGDLTTKYLIIEIMGRHSNIILTNHEMKILDCIKHIDFTISSVRQLMPGLQYVSPPPQNKTDLTDIEQSVDIDFSSPLQDAEKAILSSVSGISPLTAREIVYRAFGRTDIKNSILTDNGKNKILYETVQLAKTVKSNNFSPCMIVDSVSGKLMDFSAVEIKQYETLADIKYFDNISALLDSFYKTRDMHERMRQKSADLLKLLSNNIERISKKLIILTKTLNDSEKKDKQKIYGDLLMANLYNIEQGQTEIEVQNYYENNSPIVKITLDPRLTPSQNAQKYYKKYNKSKTAEIEAAKQIQNAKADLEYLESTLAAVETADTESDLNSIRSELIAEGYLNRKVNPKKQKQTASKPMHFVSSDGFDIYVGKSNAQNDYLTLRFANSSDWWFHTKNIHGSHTVIKLGLDKEVPKSTITEAAQLAAYYSKGRNSSQVPVDFTRIKNVRKPNGAKPGMVIYDHYNTIYVTPKELKTE
ncbi:MAG: fibronectin/fibrinogen-binding protein [Clostridia bacterium]|nr:fibronectin/fibrinogen-binding protein [Clostridia bacterium]